MCSRRGIKNLLFAPQSLRKFSLSGLFKATTDLYGNCTLRHSGTSAAAPEAAGVFALALEAKYVRRVRAAAASLVTSISINTIERE